jgi:hypothetical protein
MTTARLFFIVNTVQDAQLAAERASAEGITPFLYTSLGVHDDQLLPEEFFCGASAGGERQLGYDGGG